MRGFFYVSGKSQHKNLRYKLFSAKNDVIGYTDLLLMKNFCSKTPTLKTMKLSKIYLISVIFCLLALHSPDVKAEQVPVYMPNNNGQSLTTPVAWGASNNVVFMGAGGSIPDPYSKLADGAAVFGVGLGDPKQNIGVQASLISLDFSQWNRYSSAFQLFRDLGNANAIGVGVENVMLSNGGDSGKSFYVVYSEGVQSSSVVNTTTETTKLHYSIGAGTGRFGDKSPADISSGKGAHGTYVFGNLAYEVGGLFNLITDWNGLNLNAGVSKSFSLGSTLPCVAITLGAADLTHQSGTGVRFICAGGVGFKL